jgi:hypothetical protein
MRFFDLFNFASEKNGQWVNNLIVKDIYFWLGLSLNNFLGIYLLHLGDSCSLSQFTCII